MGKKAKKRKEKRDSGLPANAKSLEPNEFEGQLMRYVEDPNWEMLWMDPTAPIWVFTNEVTKEVASIGDRAACIRTRKAFDRAVRDELIAQTTIHGPN